MREQECVPYAPSLIESMRSLGYSFSSAVADLIDNSISAKADKIEIIAEPSTDPVMVILDDGCGMSETELYEAMRYGSVNPLAKRDPNDLGRFGLGLKSASLSQCRNLTVVSKKNGKICGSSWDLDYVIAKGKWVLKTFTEKEMEHLPHINRLKDCKHGTYILLSNFDRIMEGTGNISETFNKCLEEMSDHLSLVFHRFIEEDGLKISLNNRNIEALDPFLLNHPATQRKKEQKIHIKNETIILKPYILPHFSKLKEKDLKLIGGKDRLRSEQGFYVYRNRRLIIWGTWFRLERKDELNKLARVRVDIPNTLDYMWSIDVKKSSATLPDIIKKNMYAAVYESVIGSEQIHTHRGRKENLENIDYIWDRVKQRNGYAYLINRDIPQIKMLSATLDKSQKKMFEKVIQVLEESFPVGALYVDASRGVIEDKQDSHEDEEIDYIWKDLQIQIDYVKKNNLSVVEYYKAFSKVEPYCHYPKILEKIQKEIKKYE